MSTFFRTHKKWIVIAALPVMIALWWAFRPEKLWISQRVDEPASFASTGDPQPLYTGTLEGKVHQTSGRVTIYKRPDGTEYLRLTNFSTSNGPDVHVILTKDARATGENGVDQDHVELGALKGNQGDQNYDLPGSADLTQYTAAVIYCERFHAVFGAAELEPF